MRRVYTICIGEECTTDAFGNTRQAAVRAFFQIKDNFQRYRLDRIPVVRRSDGTFRGTRNGVGTISGRIYPATDLERKAAGFND